MQKRIVVVDDCEDFVNLMRVRLTNQGYECFGFNSGIDGLAHIKNTREKPDAIMIDLRMPGIDGIEFLKEIKNDKELKQVKCCILSSVQDSKQIESAMKAGADEYFFKNLDKDILLDKLFNLLESKDHNENKDNYLRKLQIIDICKNFKVHKLTDNILTIKTNEEFQEGSLLQLSSDLQTLQEVSGGKTLDLKVDNIEKCDDYNLIHCQILEPIQLIYK